MSNAKVIICGIVKNVAQRLDYNIMHALDTGKRFAESKVVIYENNSTDGTKDILKKYSDAGKIFLISEDISDEEFKKNSTFWSYKKITGSDHPCRMELISNARNKVVDEIRKDKYKDFDCVIWIDMDSNGWSIDGIVDSVEKIQSGLIDVLFGNTHTYYDYYALRSPQSPLKLFGPEVVGQVWWANLKQDVKINHYNMIPVYSAFNGIGVYCKKAFDTHKYDFKVNNSVKKLYGIFMTSSHPTIYQQIRPYAEQDCGTFPDGIEDANLKIIWKNNSGYKGDVVCEHVALNFGLIVDGYKLAINPRLLYGHVP